MPVSCYSLIKKEGSVLTFLDYFFIVFHTTFTIFNMVGWIWKKTRKLHIITLALTAFSWFILGIRYGWGFCFCTEWHWEVREALGRPIRFNSYIYFLINEITGATPPENLVDTVTMAVFAACVFMSVALNARDFMRWRKARTAG
jgi:hypothetical protein